MTHLARRLWRDQSGATAVEYSLMVALIALAIVAAVALLGTSLRDMFEDPELHNALGSDGDGG